MKSFSEYVKIRNEDMQPPSDPSQDSGSSQGSQDDDSSPDAGPDLTPALQMAASKYRPQVEAFLRKLAANDQDLQNAMNGNSSSDDSDDDSASSNPTDTN